MKVDDKSSKEFAALHLERLENELDRIGFEVSIAGANAIREARTELGSIPDGPIGAKIAKKISDAMPAFEKVVYAESLTKQLYVLPSRRFNSEYLLDSPAKLFKPGVFDSLPDIVRFDIEHSCRCILFGEGTAAAFHVLRATEGLLRDYYVRNKRTKRIKNQNWGPIVEDLGKKKTRKVPHTLLASLDMIRESYRNPTQHPDATYDVESAQDLFGLCIDVINKMAAP
jgi:hypothetical protein